MSYDEPKILSSQLNQFCLMGADVGHRMPEALRRLTSFKKFRHEEALKVFEGYFVTSELEDQHQIGKLLKAARQERGYTQKQVAQLAGISTLSYKFIENGRTGTRITTLMSIGRALDFEIMLVPKNWVPAVNALLDPLDVIDPSSSEAFTFAQGTEFDEDPVA